MFLNWHVINPHFSKSNKMNTWYVAITSILLLLIPRTSCFIYNKQFNFSPASQFLIPQNAVRAMLGLPPLTWDHGLANYAQWYAEQRQYDCALQHSNGPYGENLFWGSGAGWSPTQAVAGWVAERQFYDYWSNSCGDGEECGHYTQIVWRSSTRVGCAEVNCFYGRGVFIICNYDPPGNYIGERPY